MATDCVPCHFEWEEANCLRHLPPVHQRWLLREHRRIRERGYPASEVLAHAEKEERLFRRYLPVTLLEQIESDHARFHPTLEAYAHRGLLSPLGAIG